MLSFQFFKRTHCSVLVLVHILIPGPVELDQPRMLERVDRYHLFLLLAEQILFVPAHLLLLYLHNLLMRFVCLNVEAGFFALLAIVLEKFEKLDHIVVERISG